MKALTLTVLLTNRQFTRAAYKRPATSVHAVTTAPTIVCKKKCLCSWISVSYNFQSTQRSIHRVRQHFESYHRSEPGENVCIKFLISYNCLSKTCRFLRALRYFYFEDKTIRPFRRCFCFKSPITGSTLLMAPLF